MNTTKKVRSPRNPKSQQTEIDVAYREFYLATQAFRQDPTPENQRALEVIQNEVEAIENAYHEGRLLRLKRKMEERGQRGPVIPVEPVPFEYCSHGYAPEECEICNDH